jgi:hypothetical protein
MAGWDVGRLARHAAHAARFVAAGWRADCASIIAFDLVIEEDDVERDEIRSRGHIAPPENEAGTRRRWHDASRD